MKDMRMVDLLEGRRVLVTGGAGFIGSHTVDALVESGADVVVVDDLSSGKEENLNPKARFYNINVADPGIEAVMEKERPEIIYHLAFFVLVPESVSNPLLDIDCLVGSVRIFQKAKDLKVKKIVYSSSGFLYGNNPNLPLSETEPFDYVTAYAVSKGATENYLRFFNKTYGLPYTIIRYPAVYGPRQVTGAMADYIRKLAKGEQAEMWGDGNKTRDYLFVDDVVEANFLALTVPDDHPDPLFNIGTGKETTLNTLYKEVARILGREPKPIYYPDRAAEQIRYCLDSSKVEREFGWRAKTSLDKGLEKTIDFARSKGFDI